MFGAVALAAVFSNAQADDITNVRAASSHAGNLASGAMNQYSKSLYSYYSYDNSSNEASSVLLGSDLMKARMGNVTGAVKKAVADFTGSASGHGDTKMINGGCDKNKRVWLGLGWTNVSSDKEQYEFHMNYWTATLGGDMTLWNDRILFGLAAHYTYGKGASQFNQGSMEANAYGVTPYVALKLLENNGFKLSVLAMGGWEHITQDNWRTNLKGNADNSVLLVNNQTEIAGDRSRISAKPKADNWTGNISLVLAKSTAKTDLSLSVGYAYMNDKVKEFTEGTTTAAAALNAHTYKSHSFKVHQLQTKLSVGYKLDSSTTPHISFIWNQNLSDPTVFTYNTTQVAGYPAIKKNEGKNSEIGGAIGVNHMVSDSMHVGSEYMITFKGKVMTQSFAAKAGWKF